MNETYRQIIKSLQAAKWNVGEIKEIRVYIDQNMNGIVKSALVEVELVILKDRKGNRVKVTRDNQRNKLCIK